MQGKKKTVLVTGASSGIGKETVRAMLKAGYHVYAAARRLELMEDLRALGAVPLRMDVCDDAQVQTAMEKITKDSAGVDILVNNAGYGLFGSIEDCELDEVRRQFEVNLFSIGRMLKAVLPYMRAKGSGRIINVSSMGGKVYTPYGGWYHATKHAMEGLSDCLRLELQPFGIKVVIIEPGMIETPFYGPMFESLARSAKGGAYEKRVEKLLATYRSKGAADTSAAYRSKGAADISDAYRTKAAAGTSAERNKKPAGSPPAVIARLIVKAAGAAQPKTRYAGGKYAHSAMLFRKIFGDRLYDFLISRSLIGR